VTSKEFQTVGAATQNALDANAMVAGGCCNSRADVKRQWFVTVGYDMFFFESFFLLFIVQFLYRPSSI